MAFRIGHTPANKGKSSTVEPIRDPQAISNIKRLLAEDVRELALFTVAINSALRAGDLCRLQWNDALDEGKTITLTVLEEKTGKRRIVPLNEPTSAVLRKWRVICDSPYIYSGQRGPLTTATWGRMLKDWCLSVGLQGRFASHTARKTFVRQQHDQHGTSLATLRHMLNHATESVTAIYMGSMDKDVAAAYRKVI